MIQQQTDIYEKVTNAIIHAIETGVGKYTRPWHLMSSPINAFSRKGYRGINVLMLWIAANEHAYSSTEWATYKQWQENGAQVGKGERSTPVVFWKFFDQNEESEDNSDTPEYATRCFARSYNLFNANQVDGYEAPVNQELSPATRIENAERFFNAIPVNLKHGGDRAFYSPTDDCVQMPDFGQFRSPEKYYSVLSHEVAHWSGSPQRLNRDLTGRFGSEAYAWEELIAQLSASFVCAQLQLPCDPETDDAPYIQSWLEVLRNDKKAIFTAASKAQEVAAYLQQFSLSSLECAS
jgi:antirestriction protein ArdC